MKHLSLVKIIVALCILNAYLFTCAVMGTVESSSADVVPEPPSGYENPDDEAHGVGTSDF